MLFIKTKLNIDIPCIHLAFLHHLDSINVYLDGNLIEKNFQYYNLIKSVKSIISKYFQYEIDSLIYDVKINNIAMSSEQIFFDYSLFKNECSYCSANNKKRMNQDIGNI